ncbi:MAG: hypothetical protein AAF447_17835 [Myxococcota bacterium]
MLEAELLESEARYLDEFADDVQVVCPRCEAAAMVRYRSLASDDANPAPRATCTACGLDQVGWRVPERSSLRQLGVARCRRCNAWLRERPIHYRASTRELDFLCACGEVNRKTHRPGRLLGIAVDPYQALPLWFSASFKGESLWAYNRPHLSYLRQYVAAIERGRFEYPNAALGARLPRWMKAARHRSDLLAAIDRLARRTP